ncbi:chloride channel protein [Flavobacterium sp. JP2137]|uniref:chloride channel protein n=1 Tax=Flavobacterium sp. JP2137 TaxID=3414510 RepID=UPI003D300A00
MKFSAKKTPTQKTAINRFFTLLFKWSLLALLIGCAIGTSIAFFLYALSAVTAYRFGHSNLVYALPFAGLGIGLLYYYLGRTVEGGNQLLVKEYHSPTAVVPLKLVPLILIGTLTTHLFGGSAGREGTAVQMGGAIADQFSRLFSLQSWQRKLLLSMGISAGFAAVFGTPWAGTVFALEILRVGQLRYQSFIPCLLAAFAAHYSCLWWSVEHSAYHIAALPPISLNTLVLVLGCGAVFGLAALFFRKLTAFWSGLFKKYLRYPPLRPFVGGLLFVLLYLYIGDTAYLGLGLPTILNAFEQAQGMEVFVLKIVFTSITLGAGYKGGEVTPLFFIGAALGSFLSTLLPLPISLLTALGFVAVFSGATQAPWACTLMGLELFGLEGGLFLLLACWTAALFSGRQNIYNSPPHPQLSLPYIKLAHWWSNRAFNRSSNR